MALMQLVAHGAQDLYMGDLGDAITLMDDPMDRQLTSRVCSGNVDVRCVPFQALKEMVMNHREEWLALNHGRLGDLLQGIASKLVKQPREEQATMLEPYLRMLAVFAMELTDEDVVFIQDLIDTFDDSHVVLEQYTWSTVSLLDHLTPLQGKSDRFLTSTMQWAIDASDKVGMRRWAGILDYYKVPWDGMMLLETTFANLSYGGRSIETLFTFPSFVEMFNRSALAALWHFLHTYNGRHFADMNVMKILPMLHEKGIDLTCTVDLDGATLLTEVYRATNGRDITAMKYLVEIDERYLEHTDTLTQSVISRLRRPLCVSTLVLPEAREGKLNDMCPIMHTAFKVGVPFMVCMACINRFDSDALEQWLATSSSACCPQCRSQGNDFLLYVENPTPKEKN